MARRSPRAPAPSPNPNPRPDPRGALPEPGWLEIDEEAAARLAERLRRVALGLLAALLTSRFYWPNEISGEGDSGQGLLWVLVLLLTASLGVAAWWIGGAPRLRWSWADGAVILLTVLVALSAGHAAEKRLAINQAWEWVGMGLAYLLIRNLPRTRGESSAIAGALVATAVAVSAYGLYQVRVEFPRARVYYRAHPREALAQAGVDATDPASVRRFEDRLFGSREPLATFALANSLAGFLVGASALALALALENGLRGAEKSGRRWVPILLGIPPLLVLLGTLILTKSRSAYVGLLVALAVLAWRERRLFSMRGLVIAGSGLAVVLAVLVGIGLKMGELDPLVATESTKSLRYRWEYWVGTWRTIADGPWTWLNGLGPGNFRGPYLEHKLAEASEEIADPHNLILEGWATAGLPAALALLAALALGFREIFGPPVEPPLENPRDRDRRRRSRAEPDRQGAIEADPPRRSRWLIVSAGLGGWLLVVALDRLNPFAGGGLDRWLILGAAWVAAVWLGGPIWGLRPLASVGPGVAALAVAVNLLGAGGIALPSVALGLWAWLAIGQGLRDDRPCARARAIGRRGSAFGLAVVGSALIGTFIGTVGPFWEAESAIADAERALQRGDLAAAGAAYNRANQADRYASRAWVARAMLEFEAWRARGSQVEQLSWHRVRSALAKAVEPPRNPDALPVYRLRARYARTFLDRLGPEGPPPPRDRKDWPALAAIAERKQILGDLLEATTIASQLYPTSAALHAERADALARLDRGAEAAAEARTALDLDARMPHLDRKLPEAVRRRLATDLKRWESPATAPSPGPKAADPPESDRSPALKGGRGPAP